MRVRVLGPLEVQGAARIASTRQRAILTLLALEAPAVVPAERIVDVVWGESDAVDAHAALHTQLSRLRAAPGTPVIETVEPGYRLSVEPQQIDAHRFAVLVRRAGDAPAVEAKKVLEEALALWRGPTLADLGDGVFASEARRRLEELRRDAVEGLSRACVGLGEHERAIRELRPLVAADPLREGAWAVLIAALARSGRRGDALDAYSDVRRILSVELGIEPGPALRELQAEVLSVDRVPPSPGRPPSPRRKRPWIVAIGVLVLSALVAGTVLVVHGDDPRARTPRAAAAGVVLRIDAATGAVRDRYPAGPAPAQMAVGAGGAWVVDADGQTITRLGSDSRTFATGSPPLDVAVAPGGLYVAAGARAPGTQVAGPVLSAVQRIDPITQTSRARVAVPHGASVRRPTDQLLAVAAGSVWAIAADASIVRLDKERVATRVPGVAASALAAGGAGLWAIDEDGTVVRIDERRARVSARTRLPASSIAALAVGATDAWVSAPEDGTVWRVPADDLESTRAIRLGVGVRALAAGSGGVWAANPLRGTLTRFDERTGRTTRTVRAGGLPQDVALAGEDVWASVAPGPSAVTDVVAGTVADAHCGPALGRPGVQPDVVVASDLPLQGGIRVSVEHMTEAIAFELRARGFRAGRFNLAYASCDDSIARTGVFDPVRCAANARAYVRDPRVIGVIGTVNSPCTRAAFDVLPPDGPVFVSPLNTDPALTRPPRSRPFVRVIGTDALQAVALAQLTRRLGAERVYVIDDGDPAYGGMLADVFARAAPDAGVRVVGAGSWDPQHPARARLARAAARLNADAVVLAGTLDDGGIPVLRSVRRALPRARLMLTDGFTPTTILARRGAAAAEGAYLAMPGGSLDALTPTGRRFAAALARVAPGASQDLGAVYAAQATRVLVDAIARSDGTRVSVLREVRRTRTAQGLLGPVRFDATGDLVGAPVTVLRIRAGAPDGARVDRVLRP